MSREPVANAGKQNGDTHEETSCCNYTADLPREHEKN